MTINKELLEKFRMRQTISAENLKSRIGEVLKVKKWEFSEYVNADGELHNVLALSIMPDGAIVRTEVRAFIEKFRAYIDIFGELPIEERPAIKIIGKTSKKRSEYITFDIVDDDGNAL